MVVYIYTQRWSRLSESLPSSSICQEVPTLQHSDKADRSAWSNTARTVLFVSSLLSLRSFLMLRCEHGRSLLFQLSAIPMCLPDERFETKILLLQSQELIVLRLSSREREARRNMHDFPCPRHLPPLLLAAVNPQTLRFPHLVHIPCRFLNETLDALPNAFFRDEMDVPDALAVCKSPRRDQHLPFASASCLLSWFSMVRALRPHALHISRRFLVQPLCSLASPNEHSLSVAVIPRHARC